MQVSNVDEDRINVCMCATDRNEEIRMKYCLACGRRQW